ncbi:MAG: transposase [Psychromonas sp.]|nr:transposase [Psychromonas sp.]
MLKYQLVTANCIFNGWTIAIGNNSAENAIRPFVVGSKNRLHSSSVNGANASEAIYRALELAKSNGHDTYVYMKFIIEKLPLVKSDDQVAKLLPWNFTNNDLMAWDKYS